MPESPAIVRAALQGRACDACFVFAAVALALAQYAADRAVPVIEANMSAAGLRVICRRLSLPFLLVGGHAVSLCVRLMYVLQKPAAAIMDIRVRAGFPGPAAFRVPLTDPTVAKQNILQSSLGRSESVAARNRRPGRRPGAEERIGPDSWSCYPPWSFLAGRPCRLQRGIAALCALKPQLSGHLRLAYLQNGTRRTRAGSDGGSLPKNGTSRASRGGARRSISPRRRGARRSSATRRDSANPD